MSFNSYARNKTLRNVSQEICETKLKASSDNWVEKFQAYILREFKLAEVTRRSIQRVFKHISADLSKPTRSILGP